MTKDEALTMALEALETAEAGLAELAQGADREPTDDLAWCEERATQALAKPRVAIAAIKEVLAQPAQAEPSQVQQLVNEQAEDEVLWCKAHTIVESMLQAALRRLHAAIEDKPAAQAEPLTEDALLIEFGKLYPQDVGILELAKHNKDYALESIGARHHWTAFKAGARAIEAAHGIKEQRK